MTGIEDFNHPAFYAAAQAWEDAGWEVANPAEIEPTDEPDSYRFYLREDIRLLLDCDAIAMLDGYPESRGAMLEMNIAQALKIRVFDAFHPAKYSEHDFIEKGGCGCDLPDYMHEPQWWSAA
jgi:hypothetical protein